MEKQCAFCDVGTEILNITGMNLGRLVRLRRLFAILSLLRAGFDPRSLHVRFAVNKATGFSPINSGFPLSELFHQCSNLTVTYKLLLPEGHMGEAWKPSKCNALSENGEGYTGGG